MSRPGRLTVGVSGVLVAMLAWLAIEGDVTPAEVLVGLGAGGLAVLLARLSVRETAPRLVLSVRWWRPLSTLPVDMLRDLVPVCREAVAALRRQPEESRLVLVPLPDGPTGDGSLTIAMLGATLTPNTVVVGFDQDRHALLVHQLRPSRHPAASLRRRLP